MSWHVTVRDKKYVRKRPAIKITINQQLLQYIDELAERSGKSRVYVIELGLRIALEGRELERRLGLTSGEGGGDRSSSGGSSDAFLRRVLFDVSSGSDVFWVPQY